MGVGLCMPHPAPRTACRLPSACHSCLAETSLARQSLLSTLRLLCNCGGKGLVCLELESAAAAHCTCTVMGASCSTVLWLKQLPLLVWCVVCDVWCVVSHDTQLECGATSCDNQAHTQPIAVGRQTD